MKWRLVNIFNANEKHEMREYPFKIGRHSDANIICLHRSISKFHATIIKEDGMLFIIDNSMNGTYLNNEKIETCKNVPIKHMDEIGLVGGLRTITEYNLRPPFFIYRLEYSQKEEEVSSVDTMPPSAPTEDDKSVINLDDSLDFIPDNIEQISYAKEEKKLKNNKLPQPPVLQSHVDINNASKNSNNLSPSIMEMEAPIERNEELCDKISKEINNDLAIVEDAHDVIVIDSDDDDNLICSQLFIKQEKSFLVDENYVKIKNELAELDRHELEYANPSILIDSDSELETSQDLLNVLNNSNSANQEPSTSTSVEKTASSDKTLSQITGEINAKNQIKKPEIIPPLPLPPKRTKKQSTEAKSTSNDWTRTILLVGQKRPQPSKDDTSTKKPDVPAKKAKLSLKERLGIGKVKVSENRGKFLTKVIDTRAKPKNGTSEPRKKPNATRPTPKEPVPSTSNAKAAPSEAAPLNDTLEVQKKTPSKAKVNDPPDVVTPKDTRLISINIPQTVKVEQVNKPVNDNNILGIFRGREEFILKILSWRMQFFKCEQNICDLWINISGRILLKIADSFIDFVSYKNAMEQIVLSGIFSEIYEDYFAIGDKQQQKLEAATITGTVERIRDMSDFTELTCYNYIDGSESNMSLREANLIYFTVRSNEGNARTQLVAMFGIISHSVTNMVSETDRLNVAIAKRWTKSPMYKRTFFMLIKKGDLVKPNCQIYCRPFCYLQRHLKKLSAVDKVNVDFNKYILHPLARDYLTSIDLGSDLMPLDPQMPSLNSVQQQAVADAVNFCLCEDGPKLFLLEGPPGTGKSFVALNIVLQLLKNLEDNEAILLLAQSNAAIDDLLLKIRCARDKLPDELGRKIKMVRIGQYSSTSSEAQLYHIDSLVHTNMKKRLFSTSPEGRKDYERMNKQYEELLKIRHRRPDEDALLKKLKHLIDNFFRNFYGRSYHTVEWHVKVSIFEGAKIVCSTIASCNIIPHNRIKLRFKSCLIDEATQATEPDTLLPLVLGVPKIILIGDTQQLPPLHNLIPKEYMFNRSLFERLKTNLRSNQNPIRRLKVQYRMVEEICSFPNQMFYNGELETFYKKTPRRDLQVLKPYVVFEQDPTIVQKDRAHVNLGEIDIIFHILTAINKLLWLDHRLSIGIITPYNEQRIEITNRLSSLRISDRINISCNTIDSFQGKEMDIIILSLVRNLSNQFVSDAKRINVALTRAKYGLYIVASSILFNNSSLLRRLKSDAVQRKVYVSKCRDYKSVADALAKC